MSVLVFVETDGGKVKHNSLEAVTYGAAIGEATAVVLGSMDESEAATLGKSGASKILHADDERLNHGIISAYAFGIGPGR